MLGNTHTASNYGMFAGFDLLYLWIVPLMLQMLGAYDHCLCEVSGMCRGFLTEILLLGIKTQSLHYTETHEGLQVKCLLLFNSNEKWNALENFSKTPQQHISLKHVQLFFIRYISTDIDRQTNIDMAFKCLNLYVISVYHCRYTDL